MFRRALLLFLITATAALSQNWDSSGSKFLSGKYFFRYVSYSLAASSGAILEAQAISGTITFDPGTLRYSIDGQLLDSTASPATPRAFTVSAGYRLAANAIGFVDNPLSSDAADLIFGAAGRDGVFVGSSTESGYIDLFVAIPAGATAATASRVNGTYRIGALDFPELNTSRAKNALFQATANGQGVFPNTVARGRAANVSNTEVSQTLSSALYSFGANGIGTATFTNGADSAAAVFGGSKTLYVSADGNFLLGGAANGYDIFVGIRPFTGSGADAAYRGVYFVGGIDDAATSVGDNYSYLSSFYGSINALGTGVSLWHQRVSPMDDYPFDYTYDSTTALGSTTGTQTKSTYAYALGADGNSLLMAGNGPIYSLMLGVKAPVVTGGGVFMDPFGILNSATYSPITNSIAPGELITIFGSNLASATLTAQALPFPTTLGGVRVLVNERAAPVYVVSPGQLSAIVPYATVEDIANIRVVNNGTSSNSVTLFVSNCAPGVFALSQAGTGYGAILHANYQVVNQSNPAKPGETVLVFLTGLGDTTPAAGEGAPGPSAEPFARTNLAYDVYVALRKATVSYAGLAPGLAGLYQINVTIPPETPNGDQYLSVTGAGCLTEQVKIAIQR